MAIVTKVFEKVVVPKITGGKLPAGILSMALFDVTLKVTKQGIEVLVVKDDPAKNNKYWGKKDSKYKFAGGTVTLEDISSGLDLIEISHKKSKEETGGVTSVLIGEKSYFSFFFTKPQAHLVLFNLRLWRRGVPQPCGNVQEACFIGLDDLKKIRSENGLLGKHALAFDSLCEMLDLVQKGDARMVSLYKPFVDYMDEVMNP